LKIDLKKIGRVLLLLLIACTSNCSIVPSTENILLPSELAANPQKYDGQHVVVKGYVKLATESRNIFDSKVGFHDPHGACLGLDGPEEMFNGYHQRMVSRLSGTFRKELCKENEYCRFWCYTAGRKSGIELDKGSRP
jgi:hypothetical protein